MERILVVKLADIGDLLTATPALRALRRRYPSANITALVTPHTACLLAGNDAVDRLLRFPKADFDALPISWRPRAAPGRLGRALRLAWDLRCARFDALVLLHHLTTPWGRVKYRALAAATGAPIRAGLDNGAGRFLTHRAVDRGYGARHEVDYWLDVAATLDAHNPDPHLELDLTAEDLQAADARWAALDLEGKEVVALHPGSGGFSVARRWSPDRFAAVGRSLAARGLSIAVVAGPGEEALAEQVRERMQAPAALLGGIPSPRELAATLRRCRLFVGNDSGVMHCAAAVGVPVVAVFGLSNAGAWGPYPPERHRVVRLDLPCSPCFYTGHGLGTPGGCPPRTCLTALEPDLVIAAALGMLESKASSPKSKVAP